MAARNKKTALFAVWGTAKATATPVVIREVQLAQRRGQSQVALTKGRAAKDGKGLGHGTLLTVFFVGACRTQKGSGCRKLPSDSGHIPPKGLVLAHTRSRRLRKDAPQRSQDGSRAQKIHEVTVAEAADG